MMRRCWLVVVTLALGLFVLAAFAAGCHERERRVEVIHERPEREVVIEREHEHERAHERERAHEHERAHEEHSHDHRGDDAR